MSVVVACYNYGRFLNECVESVVTQDAVDVDVLIIDDASTDDSASIAEALADQYSQVTVRVNKANRGYIPTFNSGLEHITGEFVVKLDADDSLPPGALARAVTLLEAEPRVGFVYGAPLHFPSSPAPSGRTAVRSWHIWHGEDWIERRCRTGVNCISNPEVVIRTSTLQRVGGLNPNLPHTCDFELWMRLASVADVGRVNGSHQGRYRVHNDSMQNTVNSGQLTDIRERKAAFASFFASESIQGSPLILDMRRDAMRTIARGALDAACRAYDRGRVDIPVDDLVSLAFEAYPGAAQLREFRALRARQHVGPEIAPFLPHFFARAALRRIRADIARARWRRTGL